MEKKPIEKFEVVLDYYNLTEGQKAVGINFNPSGDLNVTKAKLFSAELIDSVIKNHNEFTDNGNKMASYFRNVFKTQAINCIVTAQMAVEKVLTWKD